MLTRAYAIEDRPGAMLFIGVQPGQVRPTLWYYQKGPGYEDTITLASFHGEKQAIVAANFLDAMTGQIQRVIDHLAKGDDT